MKNIVLAAIALSLFPSMGYCSDGEAEGASSRVKSRILGIPIETKTTRHTDIHNFDETKTIMLVASSGMPARNLRSECGYAFFKSDGLVSETFVAHSALKAFNPDIEEYRKGKFSNLANGIEGVSNSDYIFCKQGVKLGTEKINLTHGLFDIGGKIEFQASNMTFRDVYLWPQGCIKLISTIAECPIACIKIVPANNQKPTLISGNILFSQSPSVFLEVVNIASLSMKMR